MTPDQSRIRALTEEVEDLKEQIAFLKSEMAGNPHPLLTLGLTMKEAQFVAAVARIGRASKSQIMTAIYTTEEDFPCLKIVDVLLCKARKKLKKFGVEIKTIWGVGFEMDDASRAKVRELCGVAA